MSITHSRTSPSDMAFVLGHSHLDCLNMAAVERGFELNFMHLWLMRTPVIRDGGGSRLHPDIGDRLEPLVISLIGGAAHEMVGLLQHPVPFDFVLPERPDLPLIEDADVIPYQAILAAIEALIVPDEAELAGLIAARGSRVLQIESPPPCAGTDHIASEVNILAEMWKRPRRNGNAPSPRWLRYKLWRAHSEIVRRRCEACNVDFVPVPPQALVEGAFLAPAFYGRPCHANEAYGALVLRQVGLLP